MTFSARYYHQGAWYGIHFQADSFDEAEEICTAHSLHLDGESVSTPWHLRPFVWLWCLWLFE